MKAAFRIPGFTRLYAGLTASMVGDSIMLLVLSMWVKTLTDSNAMAGLTFFFMVIPSLFAPLMGVWLDRVRRKPFLVWGNVASAVMVLPLVLVRDEGDVWIIWAVAFLYGISFVVLPATQRAAQGDGPRGPPRGRQREPADDQGGLPHLGPLLGAALFAWTGRWLVALIDSASFAVAAVVIASIPLREEQPERDESHLRAQIVAGLRHLVADRVLANMLIGFGLTWLVLGFCEASIYALLDAFDKPATYAGVLSVTIQGVGAIAGGLSAGRLIRRIGEVAASAIGLVILALTMLGIAVARDLRMLACAGFMSVSLPLLRSAT